MGDTTITLDDAPVVGDIRGLVGGLTEDEAALVRTLTPADLPETAMVEHLFELVDLLATIRGDEALADYVYAIAPDWDGSIEMLLLGGRVTTAFARYELEHRVLGEGGLNLSPGGRCGRATARARRPRPASAGRARRPTAGPARPRRPVPPRR